MEKWYRGRFKYARRIAEVRFSNTPPSLTPIETKVSADYCAVGEISSKEFTIDRRRYQCWVFLTYVYLKSSLKLYSLVIGLG